MKCLFILLNLLKRILLTYKNMKTSLKRIITSDGLNLQGLLHEPETKTKKVLTHVHGMTGNFYENKFLDHIASTLTKNNIAFAPFNNRGNGSVSVLSKNNNGKQEDIVLGNAFEKFEDCILDIKAQIDFLEAEGFNEIHLSGHSLGAPKVAYYLHKTQDTRIKSVTFLAPADMIGLAINNKEEYDRVSSLALQMVEENKQNLVMPEYLWESNLLSPETFLNLFKVNGNTNIFNFHDSKDEYKVLNNIKTPMFVVTGSVDDILLMSAEDTVQRIKDKINSGVDCKTAIINNADHGFLEHEQELADLLLEYLKG